MQKLTSLLPLEEIAEMSSKQIIERVCLRMFEEENTYLWECKVFSNLPVVFRDILLVLELDIELNMNGILGYLENSTGLHLDYNIETLQRIGAQQSHGILSYIRDILKSYGLSTYDLRANVNGLKLYEVTNFAQTHGTIYEKIATEVVKVAENIDDYSENMFDQLIEYVSLMKSSLIQELIENQL